MEITIEELENLTKKAFEAGKNSQPLTYGYSFKTYHYDPCKNCSNNPDNGGSGICNCTLGNKIFYTTDVF